MTLPPDGNQRVEEYLRTLRRRLRGFGSDEAREIADELRSHIIDRMAEERDLDSVLGTLGSPDELASRYIADHALARAEISRTPFGVLDGLFRWATLSGAGSLVLLASIAGYFLAVALIVTALLKPFHPHTAGLWRYRDAAGDLAVSLRLGFGTPPAGAVDVTGWWIVPLGLVAGSLLITLT